MIAQKVQVVAFAHFNSSLLPTISMILFEELIKRQVMAIFPSLPPESGNSTIHIAQQDPIMKILVHEELDMIRKTVKKIPVLHLTSD